MNKKKLLIIVIIGILVALTITILIMGRYNNVRKVDNDSVKQFIEEGLHIEDETEVVNTTETSYDDITESQTTSNSMYGDDKSNNIGDSEVDRRRREAMESATDVITVGSVEDFGNWVDSQVVNEVIQQLKDRSSQDNVNVVSSYEDSLVGTNVYIVEIGRDDIYFINDCLDGTAFYFIGDKEAYYDETGGHDYDTNDDFTPNVDMSGVDLYADLSVYPWYTAVDADVYYKEHRLVAYAIYQYYNGDVPYSFECNLSYDIVNAINNDVYTVEVRSSDVTLHIMLDTFSYKALVANYTDGEEIVGLEIQKRQ